MDIFLLDHQKDTGKDDQAGQDNASHDEAADAAPAPCPQSQQAFRGQGVMVQLSAGPPLSLFM